MGRKRIPLSERLFAAVFKVYSTVSGRRFMTDLNDAAEKGYLSKVPHFNSIFNTLDDADLTPLLQRLITVSSLPLRALEESFAVDSSGFATSTYVRWFDAKHGGDAHAVELMQQHDWVKLHLICGVKTNIVTGVEVSDRNANDSPFLPFLVANTARNFTMEEVSADKAYSGRNNLRVIAAAGATPYVPFKEGTTGGLGPMTQWKRLYHFYEYQRDAFLARYHQRSNVETTFHMVKAKFGAALRSKTQVGQFNEALCKVLCHNLCVVIQSMHELGVSPDFRTAPAA
jgi:transposase